MNKKIFLNLKVFFGSLFFSCLFFGSLNVFQKNLENLLFQLTGIPEFQNLKAQVSIPEKPITFKIKRNQDVPDLEINSLSAISIFFDSKGNKKVLFEKNSEKPLPIASLTKIMTSYIIWKNYDLSQIIQISRKVPDQGGSFGNYKIGQKFFAKDLLHSMLIESSNDAAVALVELIGENNFVNLMNQKAKEIGLENTFFVNSTGLDPDDKNGLINYSTATDLAKLTDFILKNDNELLTISTVPSYSLYTADGKFHHYFTNTNKILTDYNQVLASKTGWTPQAQGCLMLALKSPNNKGVIINVILGSSDRFNEMKKLIDWINSAYNWTI